MEKIYNNEKKAKVTSPIVIEANQKIVLGSSGKVQLRKNSKNGELIEEFDVTTDKILISAMEIIIQPTNPLPYETEIHMVMSDGFVVSAINGSSFSGFDMDGNKNFKFTTEDAIGNPLEGGTVISKENGFYIVISPEKSEMRLSWYEFDKAIKKVKKFTETDGWYIPGYYEMQFYKKHLKDKKNYWTNTEIDSKNSYTINKEKNTPFVADKNKFYLVRTFKKINY